VAFGADGRPLKADTGSQPWFAGALSGPNRGPIDYDQMVMPRVDASRIFVIGRLVGQIEIQSRGTELRPGWKVIWLVRLARSGAVYYCGSDLAAEHVSSERTGNRKKERLWKEVLWYSRKVIAAPTHPALRKLWQEYREVARNA